MSTEGMPPPRTFRQLLLAGAFLAGLLNLAAALYDHGTSDTT